MYCCKASVDSQGRKVKQAYSVDPILGAGQFSYTHVVLSCFFMALAEGLGLVWGYRQLRAYAGYPLLKEAQP